MGKALVEVLHDDHGFVQHEVPVEERRHRAVGIQLQELLGLVVAIDLNGINGHALFRQHHAHAVAVVIRTVREKGH